MDDDTVIQHLRSLKPALAKSPWNVRHAWVFGSRSRGDSRKNSDLDILIEFEPGQKPGWWDFIGLEEFLTEELEISVDLLSYPIKKNRLRERVEKDKRNVF